MTTVKQLLATINAELEGQADPAYRELVRTRYNMNVDNFLGVRTPKIHKIAAEHYKLIKSKSIDDRLELSGHLLETRVYENRIMAFRWAYLDRKEYDIKHLAVFSKWLDKYVDDWIDCDDLCIHVIGEFFLKYPEKANEVLRWATSANYWVRRGAAVSLVLPVRKGEHIALVLRVADRLLNDEEDLVRKGYGWLLKVASMKYPERVFSYVMDRREKMPRVALRYAIEKLPKQLQKQVMGKT